MAESSMPDLPANMTGTRCAALQRMPSVIQLLLQCHGWHAAVGPAKLICMTDSATLCTCLVEPVICSLRAPLHPNLWAALRMQHTKLSWGFPSLTTPSIITQHGSVALSEYSS